jgi:hypothetical protein
MFLPALVSVTFHGASNMTDAGNIGRIPTFLCGGVTLEHIQLAWYTYHLIRRKWRDDLHPRVTSVPKYRRVHTILELDSHIAGVFGERHDAGDGGGRYDPASGGKRCSADGGCCAAHKIVVWDCGIEDVMNSCAV